jgi:imidazolonepropionase-like amidohydrolase
MMRLVPVVLAAVVFLAGSAAGAKSPESFVIVGDRVFDGRVLLADRAVLVKGRRIVATGALSELEVRGVRVIRLRGATILPGLIDLHVHAPGDDDLLATGLTTVRNVGSSLVALHEPEQRPGDLRWFGSGPLVTVPRGYPIPVYGPSIAYPVRSVPGARRAVDHLVRRGAALIKIALEPGGQERWPVLSVAQVEAIVQQAHRRSRKVTAHVSFGRAVSVALDGGVDELTHMPCGENTIEDVEAVADQGIPIVGTLHVSLEFGCPDVMRNARAFVRRGGKLLYGTDIGVPPIPYGLDLRELQLLHAAGLSHAETLAAATAEAGAQIGVPQLGTIASGAPADLIAVRGNPLARLEAMKKVVFVAVGGKIALGG